MRVVVPYTTLETPARDALERSGYDYEAVDVSSDSEAYWRLLAGLWAEGETFAIVEHDVTVRPRSLHELDACPEQWCGFAHSYLGATYFGMGCVKFEARLLRAVPTAMETVALMHDIDHPPKHWCRLDGWLRVVLDHEHIGFHRHEPALGHSHERPSHGCQ